MIVRIAARGRSFAGASAYYLHDKQATTSERVAWTHTENIGTQDAELGFRWMAATAIAANEAKVANRTPGRRIEKPVWTIALSWAPGEEPTREHMIETGRSWLASRKLDTHQVVMVSHQDEGYHHLHLVVNLVDTGTLKVNRAAISHAKRQSSLWAERYEREHGIHCQQRVINNERRAQGQKVRYDGADNLRARVTAAYRNSDSGAAFVAALQDQGYAIAQGRRLVVIDREGKPHALFRQVEGATSAEIKARLEGLSFRSLKDRSDEDARTRERSRSERKRQQPRMARRERDALYFDRDRQEREADERIIDAGIRHGAAEAREDRARQKLSDALRLLQDRHIAERGVLLDHHTQARLALEARLDAQYAAHEGAIRTQLASIEKSLKGRMVLGRAAKERAREAALLTAASIRQRREEATGALNAQIARERAVFEERAEYERLIVESGFTTPRAPSPQPVREHPQPGHEPTAVPPASAHFNDAAGAKEARRDAYMERSAHSRSEQGQAPAGPRQA